MVDRIASRNNTPPEDLFSKNIVSDNKSFNSISGATALKIDEHFDDQENTNESKIELEKPLELKNQLNDTSASGISIENASYIEENIDNNFPENNSEQHTPKLFEENIDTPSNTNDLKEDSEEKTIEDNLFGEDMNNEEDNFEIPAFLRRQKF